MIRAVVDVNTVRKEFSAGCDLILANRWKAELEKVGSKVYTRDLFSVD